MKQYNDIRGDWLLQIKSDIPIYIQIATDIKEQIISKRFSEGSKLPSVRDLSVIYEVTALTIQRAVQQLEYEGIIQSKKGVGNFVTENCRKTLESEMVYKQAEEFAARMKNMGLSNKNIEDLILEVLNNESNNKN